ncbi:hypothetical protein ACER0A_004085 [Haloimpatiens sp. FM7315]|uniref:hypothetical protein n=1 Tax=Haloimpatiens sp. FM7315 TaxID=3298609 RepID=UPI0035A39486
MEKDIFEENINSERDIEEEYDMMPISKNEMEDMVTIYPSMGTNAMMHGLSPMMQGMYPMMQGLNPTMPYMMGAVPYGSTMNYGMWPMIKMDNNSPWPMGNMQMMPNKILEEDYIDRDFTDIEDDLEEGRYTTREVDMILRKIETNNPGVFRLMRSYGIPYNVAKRICRRIIVLTLQYKK